METVFFISKSDPQIILAGLYAAYLRILFMKALADECLLTWN